MSEIKRRLMLWASGVERTETAGSLRTSTEVVVVEDAAHIEALQGSGVLRTESMVFVPDGSNTSGCVAEAVKYTGDAWGQTNEFGLGDAFILQALQYSTMRFVPAFGPTVVRVDNDADFAAFITDADEALANGNFPKFLKHPMNRLGDQVALGAPVHGSGPARRLHVDAAGSCSTSSSGASLGTVGTSLVDLRSAWMQANKASVAPCSVALGGRVDEATRAAALSDRPWLGDYLDAVEVLQHGEARGFAGLNVSGYGERLSPVVGGTDDAVRRGPIVAWNEEFCFVHDVETSRSMVMSLAAGRIVDLLAWSNSLEDAREFAELEVLVSVQRQLAHNGLTLDLAMSDR